MSKDPAWLLEFARDVHSQSGEDGVIGKVLEILPDKNRWCVEFGAWDGLYLSNTRALIENAGYSSVLIEGSNAKFPVLKENYRSRENVITLNALVGFSGADGLDALLADTPAPADFDFLSIDVDGNDYHIWKAVLKYRPKLVCIEYNPTIPTESGFFQRADFSVHQGSGLRALVELGRAKGYELVCALRFNAFFVDARYFPLFEIEDNRPETLRKDSRFVTHIFSGFDGTVILDGCRELPWHRIPISEARIQRLPGFLRKFPDDYNFFQKMAHKALFLLSNPRRNFQKLVARLRRHPP